MAERSRTGSDGVASSSLLPFTYYRGRVALKALLAALGVGKGDRVIAQAFTCLAVPEGILSVGARPRFVDIAAGGINIDPSGLEAAIDPTVKAIVVQHTFGIPAELDRILPVAARHGLPVIEDCCHSFGSLYRGKMLGQFGAGAFYSYEWGKQVVVGIGGSAVPTNDAVARELAAQYPQFVEPPATRVAKINLQYLAFEHLLTGNTYWFFKNLLRVLSRVGAAEGNFSAEVGELTSGFEWRMSGGLKRRLRRKLRELPEVIERSRAVADVYRARLPFPAPLVPEGSSVAYPRYPFFARDKVTLTEFARARRIELADWYKTPVHPLTGDALRAIDYEPGSCVNAERAAETVVSLPVSNKITPEGAARLVDRLAEYDG